MPKIVTVRPDGSKRVAMDYSGSGRVRPEFQKESDINNILAKYRRTGLVDHVSRHKGNYGNFINAPDYHEAMQSIVEAQTMFEALPSDIRKRFQNDPAQFLEFVQNQDNLDEMVKLGLAVRVPAAQPQGEVAPEGGNGPSGGDEA